MALMGWSLDDALLEAKNFGCSIPMQLDFIGDFGQQLARGDLAAAGYPREPLGSHILTVAERDATLAKVAARREGHVLRGPSCPIALVHARRATSARAEIHRVGGWSRSPCNSSMPRPRSCTWPPFFATVLKSPTS